MSQVHLSRHRTKRLAITTLLPLILATLATGCPKPKKITALASLPAGVIHASRAESTRASVIATASPWSVRTVTFAQPMKMVRADVVAEAHNGLVWMAIPGAASLWKDERTLLIYTTWGQFPETTTLRFTVSGLQSAAGMAIPNHAETFRSSVLDVHFGIADTGQNDCYDGSMRRACPQTHFPGQDAETKDSPVPRNFGDPAVTADYPDDPTTEDRVTDLTWKTCSEGLTGPTCGSGTAILTNWYDAINACAGLNTAHDGAGYAGRTNWRLPTIAELERLINFGRINPAIDTSPFPGTATDRPYWPASSYGANSAYAWVVFFYDGDVTTQNRATSGHIRCVSGKPTP